MSEVAIRPARDSDLDPLLGLCARYCELDRHAFDETSARTAFATLLGSDRRGFVLVAETGGALTGYAVVTWGFSIESGGLDALLDELYVEERGLGVGSRLMDAAIERATAAGASRMFLETESHNRRARMFYTRHGFEIEDSVWMSKTLNVGR